MSDVIAHVATKSANTLCRIATCDHNIASYAHVTKRKIIFQSRMTIHMSECRYHPKIITISYYLPLISSFTVSEHRHSYLQSKTRATLPNSHRIQLSVIVQLQKTFGVFRSVSSN